MTAPSQALDPPAHLPAMAADVWRETVARHGVHASRVVGPELEAYCQAVATAREARQRVAAEGMVITDWRGAPVAHPAIAVAVSAERQAERLSSRFETRVSRGRDGYMTAATRRAVKAAGLDEHEEYAGAVAATLTLALVIDQAQEEGRSALRRAAFGPIPSYLKAVKDLGLAPSVTSVDSQTQPERAGQASVESIEVWRRSREG